MATQGGVTFARVSFTPSAGKGRPASNDTRVEVGVDAGREQAAPILNDISLQLAGGSVTALLGRSGSGKTTLLRTVNGLVLPTAGSVQVGGSTLTAMTPVEELRRVRQATGYVIQDAGLFPHMTILRNVALPLELRSVSTPEREQKARAMLEQVGLQPDQYAARHPYELSGGQRQRVGLARALVNDPAVLLLDEPFGALDPLTRAEMQTMLRDLLSSLQKTVIVVTHDLQEGMLLAQRVLFLEQGSVVADLPSDEVLHSDVPAVAQYVRAANRFESAA